MCTNLLSMPIEIILKVMVWAICIITGYILIWKILKNPKSLHNFFHSTCQWGLSPSISKNGIHHTALLHVETCYRKMHHGFGLKLKCVGTQKMSLSNSKQSYSLGTRDHISIYIRSSIKFNAYFSSHYRYNLLSIIW